ncbi:hypothetical protein DSUL_20506 [Desulfovibrionales bacterium]
MNDSVPMLLLMRLLSHRVVIFLLGPVVLTITVFLLSWPFRPARKVSLGVPVVETLAVTVPSVLAVSIDPNLSPIQTTGAVRPPSTSLVTISGYTAEQGKGVDLVKGIVKPGQTPAMLFPSLLSPREICDLDEACKPVYPLSRLLPGHQFVVAVRGKGLFGFEYVISHKEKLVVRKRASGYTVRKERAEYDVTGKLLSNFEMGHRR